MYPYTALKARILCKSHNEMLHRLDDVACRFIRFILASMGASLRADDSELDYQIETSHQDLLFVSGYDIEQWFAKVTAELVFGGIIDLNGIEVRNEFRSRLADQVINISCGHGDCGIHFSSRDWLKSEKFNPIEIYPLTCDTSNSKLLIGMHYKIANFDFYYFVHNGGIAEENKPVYRPFAIELGHAAKGNHVVQLSWLVPADQGQPVVRMEHFRRRD